MGAPTDDVQADIASPSVGPNLGNRTEGNKPKGIGKKGFSDPHGSLTSQEWAPVRIPTHR
jgi:hypothetical protein